MNGLQGINELQIFDYKGKKVRTIQKDGETWWVLKDVCEILGIERGRRVSERLDTDEVGTLSVPHPQSPSKTIEMRCVNESGLYSVILRSDKAEAKPFRKWVTAEVLPSIRKTGGYRAGACASCGNSGEAAIQTNDAISRLEEQVGTLTKMVAELYMTGGAAGIPAYSGYTKRRPEQRYICIRERQEERLKSATELLRAYGLGMSTREFNIIMMEKGYLEERRIYRLKGGKEDIYKALTEKGLPYGENRSQPRCNKEPQPGDYEECFYRLYEILTRE